MKKLMPLLMVLVLCVLLSACASTPSVGHTSSPIHGNDNTSIPGELEHTHTWVNATCTTAKFCSICGATEGVSLGHNWADATCIAPKTCNICGSTEGEPSDHDWVEATCMSPKICKTCGETEGYVGDCVYVETARVEATKTADGSVTYTCACGNSYEEILYAIGSAGLEYSQNDNGTLTVTGIGTCTDTHVVIPQYFNGSKVTAIGKRAFYNLTGITEVTIPESITEIGTQIFYKCSDLHTVYYNSTYYSSDNPFLSISNIKTLVLGNTIPKKLIMQATNIKEIVLAEGIVDIGWGAFEDCSSITNVIIGNGVTSIGGYAFQDCSSLTSVTIGDSVTSIGECAFNRCSSLTSITIPDGVTSIGIIAFQGCSSLTSVTIPDSVTSIGGSAFNNCTSLTSVYISDITAWCGIEFGGYNANPLSCARKLYLNGELVTDVVIPDSVTIINDYAFYGCSSLTSVTIPDSVTSIGRSAFSNCSSLTSVTIPDSVTSIGYSAFGMCSGLTNIYFEGTMKQWESISKGWLWDNVTGNYTIYCTDGEIKK